MLKSFFIDLSSILNNIKLLCSFRIFKPEINKVQRLYYVGNENYVIIHSNVNIIFYKLLKSNLLVNVLGNYLLIYNGLHSVYLYIVINACSYFWMTL